MKLATAVMAAGALALCAPGLARANSIDTLAVYAGTWNIHTTHYKTAYSEAAPPESSILRNDCWRSEGFYACDQIVDGASRALLVYTYDTKTDSFHSTAIPAGGSAGGSGTLRIAGNVWTFPWEQPDGARTVKWRVVNTFTGSDRIESRQEYSLDGTHWTVTSRSVDERAQ